MRTSTTLLRRLRPRALGAWLALAFVLLSIVLTLVLIAVIERKASQQVKTSIGGGLAELAMQTSDKLERGMFERYREVSLIAQLQELHSDVPAAQRRAALERVQATYGYYSWIGVAGMDGRVKASARGVLEGVDVSKRPWFGNALKGIHAGDVHEAVKLVNFLPKRSEPWRFVDVAFPVVEEGKVRGVLGVHLSWEWARDVERSVMTGIERRRQVQALIVDTGGTVLLGPQDVVGKQLRLASLKAARGDTRWGYLEEPWPDGKSYLVGYAQGRGYGGYPGLGWTVLVRQEVDNAYTPVRRLREYGLASGLLAALLFSLAGVALARRITRPLGELTESARRIRAGSTERIEVRRGYREVRALGRTLNALVAGLVRRKRELEDLNTTLEQRVVQRTQELEQALSTVIASEQRTAAILEAAQDAFIGIDMRGRISDWNPAAETMLGWRRAEALGQEVVALIAPQRLHERTNTMLAKLFATRDLDIIGLRSERTLRTRDGREIPVEMTTSLAGSGDGAVLTVFMHDISERKEVDRMKNEFVATVSHELRTPLTSISASLALLADGIAGDLPDDAQELVGIANASSGRLVRLIGDVLDIQKMEAGRMGLQREVQPLVPLVEDAVAAMRSFADQAGVQLVCAPCTDAPELRAAIDRDRMTQVLTNLMSNAIKFSEPGTTVTARAEANGDRVRLSVADQGSGIPEAFRGRVFQRFAQADGADSRRKGGTGLGLSICKAIVEEHGGTIGFDSREGQGTTFWVELQAKP
nr:ATP-binding protein [uncultured Massilia sp.]